MRNLLVACLIAVSIAPSAMAGAAHFAIRNVDVAAALNSFGVPVKTDDVSLPTEAIATVPSPALHVRVLQRLADQRVMARLECDSSAECLPFVAILAAPRDASMSAMLDAAAKVYAQPSARQVAMRNGASAVLLLDGPHVHIRIPVVSLENGAVGQTIRVVDRQQHKTYTAQVTEDGTVRGRL